MLIIFTLFLAPILARAALYAAGTAPRSWRDADWSSTGALPSAATFEPARLVVFTGTTGGWKGVVSVHSWVVYKRAGARQWTRYDVVGWGNPVRTNGWPADGRWYGNMPVAIADVSGPEAEKLIPKVEAAVRAYSYNQAGDYRIWPGPNSNSFTAAVLRAVPELGVALQGGDEGAIGRVGAEVAQSVDAHERFVVCQPVEHLVEEPRVAACDLEREEEQRFGVRRTLFAACRRGSRDAELRPLIPREILERRDDLGERLRLLGRLLPGDGEHALELDERPEALHLVEVDAHVAVEVEQPPLGDDARDAVGGGEQAAPGLGVARRRAPVDHAPLQP